MGGMSWKKGERKMSMEKINREGARGAGVLLHISSLPGKYGIGTLGKSAYDFVDFLKKSGVGYWQVLPLVQTGFGDSPYQSVCCNSGNPYFIDPDMLYEQGLLLKKELKEGSMPAGNVDYALLYHKRYALLRKAFARFDVKKKDFVRFVAEGKYKTYAEYMTVKQRFDNRSFFEWEEDFKLNRREVVEPYVAEHRQEFLFWNWVQYEFSREWTKLKAYANRKGIRLIGDIPLYVAYDSADVWGMPELFQLNEDRSMKDVAGCPPDYFSEKGQLWGNPLYGWEAQREDGYSWWINRLKDALTVFDVVRIDHFRGLDRYYAIPADREDAVIGEWRDGPKSELFALAEKELGDMNVIAEDLGVMDDGVRKLLSDTGYPGMKILLFAFDGGDDNSYLPKNIGHNSVCYTGTHDNDTAIGYCKRLHREEKLAVRAKVRKTVREEGLDLAVRGDKDMCTALVHLLFACDACLSVLPLQDLLMLDNEARMNHPSTGGCNWKFRLKSLPSDETAAYLKGLLKKYKRL